jgi:glycosyltransferase involved in cell wall biosynthesis
MISLVLTNRNRDIHILKNCLHSLQNQSDKDFEWFLVDYGSDDLYLNELKGVVVNYPQIQFISCPTQGQLWSKCRAINIAIQKATQPYFVVGDIDLIFHPDYISLLKTLAKENEVHYFQYGFLNESESLKEQKFEAYKVDFKGFEEVTGNTMFPTDALRKTNGFDEFYQGWGAEDTDAHIRMRNLGLSVFFYDKNIVVKHQWHPKAYRSKESLHPYHSRLERINHAYMIQTEKTCRTVVNQNFEWGKMTDITAYAKLDLPTLEIKIENSILKFQGLLAQFRNFKSEVVRIEINKVQRKEKLKNKIKQFLGKKYQPYYAMEELNNLLLEELIKDFRNCPYTYAFDRQTNRIVLTINFT